MQYPDPDPSLTKEKAKWHLGRKTPSTQDGVSKGLRFQPLDGFPEQNPFQ